MAWEKRVDVSPLEPGEVHLWLVDLSRGEPRAFLSSEERERAARFHFERDRGRYSVCRSALRELLAGYLDAAPEEIEFRYGEAGKPELAQGSLRFNVSHSHDLALIAMAREWELGVDIERIRTGVEREGIAERFFSPGEAAALRAMAAEERDEAFFRCWTRKEAYVKARGGGLSIPLDSFDVTLDRERAELSRAADAERWRMMTLDTAPGFAAALVVEASVRRLRCFAR